MFQAEDVCGQIIAWLKEKVNEAGAKGIIFGLSGGIDSAVVAFLGRRAFGNNVLGVIMPCESDPSDAEDAKLVAESGGIPYRLVNLDGPFREMLKAVNSGTDNRMAMANLKPRLRMATLYYLAACNNYLVAGTGNLSEITVGYFTKYGDSGVDIMPIAGLVKTEVWQLAEYLGIPERIIKKDPSAGLWQGQTDESEMGFSYEALDTYIRTGQGDPGVIKKIRQMYAQSEHKRNFPPRWQMQEHKNGCL